MAEPAYAPPYAKDAQKRVHLYPGVGSRDYALMGNANAKAKRNPDGSMGESMGDEGAYGGSPAAAFPTAPEAFPTASEGG